MTGWVRTTRVELALMEQRYGGRIDDDAFESMSVYQFAGVTFYAVIPPAVGGAA